MNEFLKGTVSIQDILSYLSSDPWMDKKEAAKHLRMSVRTLEQNMKNVRYYKPSGEVLFRKSDLDRWVRDSEHVPKLKERIRNDHRGDSSPLKALVRKVGKRMR